MAERIDNWLLTHFSHSSPSSTGAQAEREEEPASNRRRRGRRNRDRNAIQRSDSGMSVKTLPEYNTSLGENELMLYKANDSQAGQSDLTVNTGSSDMTEREAHLPSRNSRQASAQVHVVTQTDDGEEREEVTEEDETSFNRTTLTGMAVSGFSALRRSLRRSMQSDDVRTSAVDVEAGNEMESLSLVESSQQTQASPSDATPAYDSLYPVISVEEVTGANEASPPTAVSQRTHGVNALRNIFRRQPDPATVAPPLDRGQPSRHRRFASTASVLSSAPGTPGVSLNDGSTLSLVPTRSNDPSLHRPSTSLSSRRVLAPFLGTGNVSSVSLLSGLSTEQASPRLDADGARRSSAASSRPPAHHRNISAPLSIRRLQFEPPVAGFTDQQMAFLASVESLDRYGIPLSGEEGGAGRQGGAMLPSFEQLARQQERAERERQLEAAGAAGPARPAPMLTLGELHVRREQEASRSAEAEAEVEAVPNVGAEGQRQSTEEPESSVINVSADAPPTNANDNQSHHASSPP